MIRKYKSKKNGYIALTSIIILSLILESIVLNSSLSGYFVQRNVLQTEYKEKSFYQAQSCVAEAILKLVQNNFYRDPISINFSNYSCSIDKIELQNQQFIITTSSNVQGFITILETKINSEDFSVITFREMF